MKQQSLGAGKPIAPDRAGRYPLWNRRCEAKTMTGAPKFEIRLARTEAEREASQRLRYDVFVRELGASADSADHDSGLERDAFDPFFDHLLLFDNARAHDPVVGVYRVLRSDQRSRVGRFYSEAEFDLGPLLASDRRLLELGRSCVHRDYRGGPAMYHLWQGLANYVSEHEIEVLFGVASFHGTDPASIAAPLSHLYHNHLAPENLRPRSKSYQTMNFMPAEQVDRAETIKAVPALIKAYLRLGGVVGDGAFIDHDFNTIDVCLVMDTAKLSDRHRKIYAGDKASA